MYSSWGRSLSQSWAGRTSPRSLLCPFSIRRQHAHSQREPARTPLAGSQTSPRPTHKVCQSGDHHGVQILYLQIYVQWAGVYCGQLETRMSLDQYSPSAKQESVQTFLEPVMVDRPATRKKSMVAYCGGVRLESTENDID